MLLPRTSSLFFSGGCRRHVTSCGEPLGRPTKMILRLSFLILLYFLPLLWTPTSQRGGCAALDRGGYRGPPGVWWSPLRGGTSGRPSGKPLGCGAYYCPRTEPADEEAKGLSPASQKQEHDCLLTQTSGEFSSPYGQGRESDARLPRLACDPAERACSRGPCFNALGHSALCQGPRQPSLPSARTVPAWHTPKCKATP